MQDNNKYQYKTQTNRDLSMINFLEFINHSNKSSFQEYLNNLTNNLLCLQFNKKEIISSLKKMINLKEEKIEFLIKIHYYRSIIKTMKMIQ